MDKSKSTNKKRDLSDYIDLTAEEDISLKYKLDNRGFTCVLTDINPRSNKKDYRGFILAKSNKGNAFTVCDIDFEYSTTDEKFAPRLTFCRTNASLETKQVSPNNDYSIVSFRSGKDGYREFWKMIAFLSGFKNILDEKIFQWEYRLTTDEDIITTIQSKKDNSRAAYLAQIIEKSGINESDVNQLLNFKKRERDLKVFRLLLDDEDDYRKKYREHYSISKPGDEAIWHHFLLNHTWIFGLALDFRCIEDFLDEQHVGINDSNNAGSPIADFIGINEFTTLIEIKTPELKFFNQKRTNTSRSTTASFLSDFVDGVSQCLSQKDKIDKSFEHKIFRDSTGQEIDKRKIRNINPKVFYIAGNKEGEMPFDDVGEENQNKKDTLERFIRGQNNLEIISYDELYDRASKIINLIG